MKSVVAGVAVTVAFISLPRLWSAEPSVSKTHVADVAGEVVKVEGGHIALKVPVIVPKGTTRRHVGGRSVPVPKVGVKFVDESFGVAAGVRVKTAAGKAAKLDDVGTGTVVEVRVDRVTEWLPGGKSSTRLEVTSITVPTAGK